MSKYRNVGCLQSFSPCSVLISPFLLSRVFWLGKIRCSGHYIWRPVLHPSIRSRLQRKTWWCGIVDDEGVEGEEAFEVSEEVSPNHLYLTNYQTLCQDGHNGFWPLHVDYSNRLCYFVDSEFYSITSSTRRKILLMDYSSSFLNHRLTLQSSTLHTSTFSATYFATDSI